MDNKQKCGFIALAGAPNAGKSTLLNNLIGNKVSIVTPKVQTTRTIINGITIYDNSQLIFIDTPGIFTPKKRLEKSMVRTAWSGVKSAEFIALMVDCKKGICEDTRNIIKTLKSLNQRLVLILNKTDLIKKEELLPLSQELNQILNFEKTFMISALKGDGVSDIKKYFAENVPVCPWLYYEDEITTAPSRFLSSEVTREKLFLKLQKELPYNLTVETDTWEQKDDGSIKLNQTIIVSKPNYKKIILGKHGAMIKLIGTLSRKELEDIFERKFHLFLFVKVRENWDENPANYSYMGMEFPS